MTSNLQTLRLHANPFAYSMSFWPTMACTAARLWYHIKGHCLTSSRRNDPSEPERNSTAQCEEKCTNPLKCRASSLSLTRHLARWPGSFLFSPHSHPHWRHPGSDTPLLRTPYPSVNAAEQHTSSSSYLGIRCRTSEIIVRFVIHFGSLCTTSIAS